MVERVCLVSSNFNKLKLLREFLKDDVEIRVDTDGILPNDDCILVSDSKGSFDIKMCQQWEGICNFFSQYVYEQYGKRYDRFFLENKLRDVGEMDVDMVAVGSSYARFGLVDIAPRLANLSLQSQDIYYGIQLVKEAYKRNSKIKHVLFGMGYYSFFSDLSKAGFHGELRRVSSVYYPLFKKSGMHNATILPEDDGWLESPIWDIERIVDLFASSIYRRLGKSFFNQEHTRDDLKTCLWGEPSVRWRDLSGHQKEIAGAERAKMHNKMVDRRVSHRENVLLFEEFCGWCADKDITVWVVVFPVSKQYAKNLIPEMKSIFYQELELLPYEVQLIDLFDCQDFEDKDFNDMDHLSDEGAGRATDIILQQIGRSSGNYS